MRCAPGGIHRYCIITIASRGINDHVGIIEERDRLNISGSRHRRIGGGTTYPQCGIRTVEGRSTIDGQGISRPSRGNRNGSKSGGIHWFESGKGDADSIKAKDSTTCRVQIRRIDTRIVRIRAEVPNHFQSVTWIGGGIRLPVVGDPSGDQGVTATAIDDQRIITRRCVPRQQARGQSGQSSTGTSREGKIDLIHRHRRQRQRVIPRGSGNRKTTGPVKVECLNFLIADISESSLGNRSRTKGYCSSCGLIIQRISRGRRGIISINSPSVIGDKCCGVEWIDRDGIRRAGAIEVFDVGNRSGHISISGNGFISDQSNRHSNRLPA